VDACRYFGALLVGAIHGVSKAELLAERYMPIPGYWEEHPLVDEVDAVATGSFTRRHPPDIRGTGYVVHSLEATANPFATDASWRSIWATMPIPPGRFTDSLQAPSTGSREFRSLGAHSWRIGH
jgi:hypothetical protein